MQRSEIIREMFLKHGLRLAFQIPPILMLTIVAIMEPSLFLIGFLIIYISCCILNYVVLYKKYCKEVNNNENQI